jgi:hypothetical protein
VCGGDETTRERGARARAARAARARAMKRPGIARADARDAPSTASDAIDARAAKKARANAAGGLLASILGDVKRSNAQRAKTVVASGGRAITRDDVVSRETKAMEARRKFEREVRERIEREVAGSESAEAFCEFETMEKQWRNIVHEIAAEMKLFSESVEVGATGEEKFVIVHKKAPEVERDAESLRNEIAARERAGKHGKKGEGLSDKAPTYAADAVELTVVGTVKRDLRSVEETIADMRKAREKTDA